MKMGTTRMAQACLRTLASYGKEQREVAPMTKVSFDQGRLALAAARVPQVQCTSSGCIDFDADEDFSPWSVGNVAAAAGKKQTHQPADRSFCLDLLIDCWPNCGPVDAGKGNTQKKR